ncbi:MAG: hypothetical protein WCD52_00480 [Xanthobacteraceae bacterium]
MRILIRHAFGKGLLDRDPSVGIRRPKGKEIRACAAFEDRRRIGTKQRTAYTLLPSPDLAPVQKRLRTFSSQFHDFRPVRAQIATARRRTLCIMVQSRSIGSALCPQKLSPRGGFHNFEPAISGKWLAYLNQIAPGLRRVAVLHVPEIAPNVAFLRVVEAAAPQMGIAVWPAEIRNADDIERVLSDFKQQGGGLIVTPSALTATRRDLIEDRLRSHCPSRFDNQPPGR